MSCGCNKPKNRCVPNAYVDVSCATPKEWDDVPVILGITECGQVTPVEKPIYELSAEDREKLDALELDGDGTYFLADDGTYKKIEFDTDSIVLNYNENPANFIINNQPGLTEIWNKSQDGIEAFVRITGIDTYTLPLDYAFGTRTLILEYDRPIITVNGDDITYTRLKILIGMYTKDEAGNDILPFNLIYYDVKQFVDADGIVITNGDGASALFNDGNYKPVYTKAQVDAFISDIEVELGNAVLYNSADDIDARNNIILKNNANLLGTTLAGGTINLIQCSRFSDEGHPITDIGSSTAHITLNSYDRPNIQLSGESGNHLHQVAYLSEIEEANTIIKGLREDVETNAQSISDLQTSTEASFNTVNGALDGLDSRLSTAEINIDNNTTEIQDIRDDLNSRTALRGYFDTTTAILAIPNPSLGDYAYNAETGTIWSYRDNNGNLQWGDTFEPIPTGAVQPGDTDPLMDGIADAGSSVRYSRADHRHPHDTTKADASDLDNYLPLAGNTQTTRMTGPLWISSGQRINISNSGNSYIQQNTTNNTTEIVGNGVGGIDLIVNNGDAKVNGDRIITETELNSSNASITTLADRVTVNEGNISSLTSRVTQAEGNISSNTSRISTAEYNISTNTSDIATNTSDIESILSRLAEEENFRGYKLTTADVTAISNPQNGNYAYNLQSGTIWIYNGTTWADSQEPIPDGAIQAYDGLPLEDGNADSGSTNEYARGDHRHPSDSSKANVIDLIATDNRAATLRNDFESYVNSNDSDISNIQSSVNENSNNISSLTSRVSTNESDILILQGQATTIGEQVNTNTVDIADAVGRIGVNELDIQTLFQSVNDSEHFRGYFLTNAELTQTAATQGDFAWSAESGTIWVYDESIPSWTDTGDPIPAEAVTLSNNLPLVNGTADAGNSTEVSRWDHIHPSDPTKADVTDIPTAVSQLTNDSGFISASDVAANYVPLMTYNDLADRVSALEAILSGVTGFWTGTQAEYDAITNKVSGTYYHIYEDDSTFSPPTDGSGSGGFVGSNNLND